jgi:hypothetical protein
MAPLFNVQQQVTDKYPCAYESINRKIAVTPARSLENWAFHPLPASCGPPFM